MRQSIGSKEGSVLLATAGITLVAAAVVGGYLKMTLMELKLSQKTFLMQRAMNFAEAGLEEGMDAINTDDWTGWTSVGYCRKLSIHQKGLATGISRESSTVRTQM